MEYNNTELRFTAQFVTSFHFSVKYLNYLQLKFGKKTSFKFVKYLHARQRSIHYGKIYLISEGDNWRSNSGDNFLEFSCCISVFIFTASNCVETPLNLSIKQDIFLNFILKRYCKESQSEKFRIFLLHCRFFSIISAFLSNCFNIEYV